MKWPVQSPDHNPLENLWSDFKHRFHKRFMELYQRPSHTMDAKLRYIELLKEVWATERTDLVNKLLASMKTRCELVIANNGLWSGY